MSRSFFRSSADSLPTKKLISSAAVENASHMPKRCKENSPDGECSRKAGTSREIQKRSPKEKVEMAPRIHVHSFRSTTAEKVICTRYKRLNGFVGPPLSARVTVRHNVSKPNSAPTTCSAFPPSRCMREPSNPLLSA